ncbi:hypothetical protein TRFO_32322 [Tritrichomonas foetus]|uniref:Uncharacterized protein n=1 Tax=Tritrichomonas foetus TaxID=1144522 RepID=A0A1J4JTQ6_9EUKA|nr:hypothetical protein TRFO_32322 [Tritrichomonas foetus]|eukprot:OHT00894.1 hypothetical protein TRFO_32322 [Tritrichomonas foetus]
MQVGELVSCISAFPGISSHCAFGCESGLFGVFDSETNEIIYQSNQQFDQKVKSICVDDDNVVYAIDSHRILRYDTRIESTAPTLQMQYEFEIFGISVKNTSIAVISKYNGITTTDNRHLQRKINETQINSVPPSVIRFYDENTLFACYEDSAVGKWHFLSEDYNQFDLPLMLRNRKLRPLSILPFSDSTLVGYESGFSIYDSNGNLSDHSSFEQRGRFQKSDITPCLGEKTFITIVDESTLLPISLDGKSTEKFVSKELHGSLLTGISANGLFVFAIEDDDEGFITVLLPEVFQSDE